MRGGGVYPGLENGEKMEMMDKTPPPSYLGTVESEDEGEATTGSWQRNKGLLACNRYMLERQLACDVWFTLGADREKVGAHRYVLLARSGVFYAMLDGPGADRTHFHLPDIQPKVFWQFLRYLYYEELYPSSDSVLDLLVVCDKYDVTAASRICLSFLMRCITVETACSILETAHRHDDEALSKECLVFIRKHGEDVVQTKGVDDLCRECLNKVLTLDGLTLDSTMCSEIADRWARRRCEEKAKEATEDNKQDTLKDVVYVKRDDQHSHRFILDSVTDRQLSGSDEADDPPPLYRDLSMESGVGSAGDDFADNVSIASSSSAGSKRSVRSQFSRQPSYAAWSDLNCVTRFREVEGAVANDGKADAVCFTVDHNVYLYGFGVYGSKKQGEAAYKVDTIVTRKKRDVLMESISIKGAGVILPVMFERPVKVEKGKPYTLEVYIHGPPSHFGSEGQASVGDGMVTFKFSKAANIKGNRTSDSKGQIPRLYFLPY